MKQCVINAMIILALLAQQQKILQKIAEGWGRKTTSNAESWSPLGTAFMVAGSSQSKVGSAGRVHFIIIEKSDKFSRRFSMPKA